MEVAPISHDTKSAIFSKINYNTHYNYIIFSLGENRIRTYVEFYFARFTV